MTRRGRAVVIVDAVLVAVAMAGCGAQSRAIDTGSKVVRAELTDLRARPASGASASSTSVHDQLTDLGVRPEGGSSPGCQGLYQPGQKLDINAYHFKAGTPVRVFVTDQSHRRSAQVASLTADSNGAISARIRIPLTARGFIIRKNAGAGLIFFDAIGLGADGVSHADATQMAGLVPRGKLCAPQPERPVLEGDPGNRRLHQLAGDPIFHSPPWSATTPRLTLSPATYEQTDFGAGGWSGPSVVLTFTSSKSRRSVYEQVTEDARSDGWHPVNMSRFGFPESWDKTYPNGASGTLGIVWLGPVNPPPGPIRYQLSGSISLPTNP